MTQNEKSKDLELQIRKRKFAEEYKALCLNHNFYLDTGWDYGFFIDCLEDNKNTSAEDFDYWMEDHFKEVFNSINS